MQSLNTPVFGEKVETPGFLFVVVLLLACFAMPISFANDRLSKQCHPSGTIINGGGGAWDTIFNAAKRNARIKWRIAVRSTATMGRDWDDWGLANRDVFYNDCHGGYCCTTKKIWGVKWHRCSAYAIPCRYVDVPRQGETPQPPAPPPRRVLPGLVVEGIALKAERVSRSNECPAVFVLRAKVVATGEIGEIQLKLKGGNDRETITLDDADFVDNSNGKKVARHNFVRKFNGVIDRAYTLKVVEGRTAWGNNPRRITPTRISSNCRTAGINGLTTPQDQNPFK